MTWQASTTSGGAFGSASMGAGTTLNRQLVTTPANVTMSAFWMRTQIDQGGTGVTYAGFPSGTLSQFSSFVLALSFVPTGTSVPSLATTPDDPAFLFFDDIVSGENIRTINTAGSPAYVDLYSWDHLRSGRMQIRSTVTGAFYMHILNTDTATHLVGWRSSFRGSYASFI